LTQQFYLNDLSSFWGTLYTTPVVWVAAVHDDHTDKNHVHALAAIQGRLDKPDLDRLRTATTTACLEQRQELDRARERNAREKEREDWGHGLEFQEDTWGD
jgi:hypothetical protein